MNLSISNSKYRSKRILLFASALLILTLFFGLLNVFLFLRFETKSEIQEEQQWMDKMKKKPLYSILIFGDSRMYRGVNPAILEEKFHIPAYNVAVSGAGMTATMFRYFNDNKLSPHPGLKIVILGISPHSLNQKQRNNRHFNSLLKKAEQISPFQFGQIDYLKIFFKPMDQRRFREIRHKILKKEKKDAFFSLIPIWINGAFFHDVNYKQKWFNDGLTQYRENTAIGKFSEESLSDLCSWTRKWTEKGILVFGLRPPTSSQMEAIENQLPGYNEQNVKTEFEKAGGIYLSFPRDAYQTYDASHLNKVNANRFSKDLAEAIKQELIKRNKL